MADEQTSSTPADPQNPVLDGKQEMGEAFSAWFLTASPTEVAAFVAANGQRVQQLKDSGDFQPAERPVTWPKVSNAWS